MSWFERDNDTAIPNASKKKKYTLKGIFGGDVLIENFFNKQFRLIVLIVVLILVFITNRYSMTKKIVLIEDLKKELIDVKYDNQIISAELISKTRPAEIEKMLKERNIELADPVEPAYEIQK